MIKVIFVMYRRPDMSREEFNEYWRGMHASVARQVPEIREYFQNHLHPDLPLGEPPCDGIAELWFDSLESLQSALGTPAGQNLIADLAEFADTDRTRPVVVQRVNIIEPATAAPQTA
jgi:uncharacterized protein (TIGR02118 family)